MVTLAKVTVKGGLFSSAINAKTPHFHTGKAAWVGIKIGIDPELPRVALHKVPYAIRADSAVTLACTGCISSSHLASSVLSGYAQKTTLSNVASSGKYTDLKNRPTLVAPDQTCPKGQLVGGLSTAGKVVCRPDADTKFTGANFALAKTACPAGKVMTGVAQDGNPTCAAALLVNGSKKTVNAMGSRLTHVLTPTAGSDAATKAYVDGKDKGLLTVINGVRYMRLYQHADINITTSTAAETHPRLNITATRKNYIGSVSFELVGSSHSGFYYSKGPKAIIYANGNITFSFFTYGSALYVDLNSAGNFMAIRSSVRLKVVKVTAIPKGAKPVLKMN